MLAEDDAHAGWVNIIESDEIRIPNKLQIKVSEICHGRVQSPLSTSEPTPPVPTHPSRNIQTAVHLC